MNMVRSSLGWLATWKRRFDISVDKERASDYQKFYYPMIFLAGLYLAAGADDSTNAIQASVGSLALASWLGLHFVCPWLALLGRWMTSRAAKAPEGAPNSAYAAAWLQLCGDGGVWGAILVYFFCVANTYYWGQPLYTTFYFLMALPGGFMFTYRSYRRLRQIRRRAARL